jgi:hypothetical protein
MKKAKYSLTVKIVIAVLIGFVLISLFLHRINTISLNQQREYNTTNRKDITIEGTVRREGISCSSVVFAHILYTPSPYIIVDDERYITSLKELNTNLQEEQPLQRIRVQGMLSPRSYAICLNGGKPQELPLVVISNIEKL